MKADTITGRKSRWYRPAALAAIMVTATILVVPRQGHAADVAAPTSPKAGLSPAVDGSDQRGCPRHRVMLIAHRGTGVGTRVIRGRRYTEDTLSAFREAMTDGADGFETDYWPTSDHVLVSHHDSTLERMTNGAGTLAAHPWSAVRHLVTPSGSRLSSLTQVQRAMHRWGGPRQQEIKDGSQFTDDMLQRVIDIDLRYGDLHKVLVTSSEVSTLSRIQQLDPRIETGLIARSHTGRPRLTMLPPWLDVILIDLNAADEPYVRSAHRAGYELSLRGVDTRTDLATAVDLGADRVVTDRADIIGADCS